MDPGNMGPLGEWLPETIWPKLKSLERIKRFQNIGDAMQSDSDDWQVRMLASLQVLGESILYPYPSLKSDSNLLLPTPNLARLGVPFRLQAWFDDEKADQAKLPGEFEKSLNAFDRLILLRAMRPDRVSTALAKWIGEVSEKRQVSRTPR